MLSLNDEKLLFYDTSYEKIHLAQSQIFMLAIRYYGFRPALFSCYWKFDVKNKLLK